MSENEMIGWHHQLNGHQFEQSLGDSEGKGSLACYSPWCHKESDDLVTEQPQKTFPGIRKAMYTHFISRIMIVQREFNTPNQNDKIFILVGRLFSVEVLL